MAIKSLEQRFLLIILPMLLSWFILLSIIISNKEKNAVNYQAEKEAKRLTAIFSTVKDKSLTDLVNNIRDKIDNCIWISVYNEELNCMASTKGIIKDGGDSLRIAFQLGCQVAGFEEEGKEKIYRIITPVFSENDKSKIYGLLDVGMYPEGTNKYILLNYQYILMGSIVGIIILSVIFHYTFIKYITTPIKKLIAWTNLPGTDIELIGKGDISELARHLNRMSKKMIQNTEALRHSKIKLTQDVQKSKMELRKISQDLEEAQNHLIRAGTLSALGEFAAGVSHELNNPIGIILGFSQHLLDEVDSKNPRYNELKRIEIESLKCKKIVEDLLNFAKPSEPNRQIVQLNEILDETLQLISYQILPEQINIIKKYHTPLPKIVIDPNQMEQVLTNIIVNAIQAMPQGGDIFVSTSLCELTQNECIQIAASLMEYSDNLLGEDSPTGKSKRLLSDKDVHSPGDEAVKIEISDTGTGVSKEDLVKLFNPFFTTKEEGTGLGLSISWKLVKRLGGIIEVKSKPGEGTTFTIKIPLKLK